MNPECNDSNAMVHQLWLYLIVLFLLSRANILPPQHMQAEREKERCWMHADWANIIRRTIIMVIILPSPHPSLRRLRHCASRRLGLPLLHSRSTPCLPTCLFARAHAMQKAHRFSANFVITAPLIVRGTKLFSYAFVCCKLRYSFGQICTR